MTSRAPQTDSHSTARLTDLADYVVPFVLRAVCDLRVADHLTDGPRDVGDLAERTGTHAPTLARALRALAARGVFTEVRPWVFGLTPLAEPLRGDHPQSLRDAYPLIPQEVAAWGRLDHTLRTGEAAYDVVHGTDFWSDMARHPQESLRFDASQEAVTRRELRAALAAYDWTEAGPIVDVGGGNGAFLAGLLAAQPGLHGVLIDQAHVVAAAPAVLAAAGVTDRCEIVGGSFFDKVPAGGRTYLLKRILYAWGDEAAAGLLRAVRRELPPDGRLLIMEPLVETGDEFSWGKLYDVLLVTLSGGGARTREQMDSLLARCGLRTERVTSTRMLPILEARPV